MTDPAVIQYPFYVRFRIDERILHPYEYRSLQIPVWRQQLYPWLSKLDRVRRDARVSGV